MDESREGVKVEIGLGSACPVDTWFLCIKYLTCCDKYHIVQASDTMAKPIGIVLDIPDIACDGGITFDNVRLSFVFIRQIRYKLWCLDS